MTTYEFDVEYDKLRAFRPRYYNKDHHRQAIFAAVRFMDLNWFKEIVQITIKNPKLKINIAYEARAKRISDYKVKQTKLWLKEQALKTDHDVKGLNDYLTSIGAKDTTEAIKIIKERGLGGGEDEKKDT
jgi:inner membrane protein involved in colicin E2 resistance